MDEDARATEYKGEAAYEFIERHGLRELASADWGWSTLYRGPADHLWEKTYPQSHQHGGGPPLLHVVSEKEAKEKYGAAAVAGRGDDGTVARHS